MDQPPTTPPAGSGPPPGPEPSTGWSPSQLGQGPSTYQPTASVPPSAAAAPTPPPAPTQPGWAAPTQPGWAAPVSSPAPVGWAAPPVARAGAETTTGFAKAAGVLLIVFGLLLGLFGLVALAASSVVNETDNPLGSGFAGLFATFGVILVVFALIEIVGGIGAWGGRGWGRVIGLVYGVLGILIGLGNAIGSRSTFDSGRTTGTGLVILAIYGFITVALAFRWKTAAR